MSLDQPRTLLEQLIAEGERSWAELEAQFIKLAREVAREDGDAPTSITWRQLQRLAAGQIKRPRPVTARVLQRQFGRPIGQLLGPPRTTTSTRLHIDISDLVREISWSGIDDDEIDGAERKTASLAEVHTQVPPKVVLSQALDLHRQIQVLLRRRQRLSQKRDLYRIESELLAHACLLYGDLKQDLLAEQFGRAALAYAREAQSGEAIAWTALAKTLRWQGRLTESMEAARRGFECSPSMPIRIQLASQEANAAALLGNALRAREALTRAERETDSVAPDSGRSAWSFPTGRQAIFALSVATQIGDCRRALGAAASADAAWAAGTPRVPANWAQIRMGAGIAHLMNGSLEHAIAEVAPVLTLPADLRVATVTGYSESLQKRLNEHRFAGNQIATDLRRELVQFNRGALLDDESAEKK